MNNDKMSFSDLDFGNITSKSRVQKIVEEFSSTLVENDVSPGMKMPSEKALVEKFGVSRGTIRQALSILISMGVLASVPGKGYYVTRGYHIPLKAKKLQDYLLQDNSFFHALEARRIVEQNIIKLAAERATEDDLATLNDAVEQIKTKNSLKEKLEAARKVHLEIAKCTHNEVLVGLMEQLLIKIEGEARDTNLSSVAAYKHHKDLVEKLKQDKLENLDRAVDEHLEFVREEFMQALKSKKGEVFESMDLPFS